MKATFSGSILLLSALSGLSGAVAKESGRTTLDDKGRLDRALPPVYVSFERWEAQGGLSNGSRGPVLWFRLTNNTKWRVFLSAEPVDDGLGRTIVSLCPGGGPATSVEKGARTYPLVRRVTLKGGRLVEDAPPHPLVSGLEFLPPGSFATFDVPAAALTGPEQQIQIDVTFEWEMNCGKRLEAVAPEMLTRVVFRTSQLPVSVVPRPP